MARNRAFTSYSRRSLRARGTMIRVAVSRLILLAGDAILSPSPETRRNLHTYFTWFEDGLDILDELDRDEERPCGSRIYLPQHVQDFNGEPKGATSWPVH